MTTDVVKQNWEYTKLLDRVKRLEREHYYVILENRSLKQRVAKLEAELEKLKKPPLLVGRLIEVLDENRAIVKSSTGPRFVVNIAGCVDRDALKPGVRVALNQRTLSIVDVLPYEKDLLVTSMEVIEKPNITYNDIGGLKEQIREVRELIELPLRKPDLFEKLGVEPPKGVLFYGPPGTGKTLLAKAVANETDATFIRLVASELVQKFIGEGARLVRELFRLAKEKAPSIVFIDEVDAIASKRLDIGTGGDREVQRTLMQLLSCIDGFDSLEDVKIIGATNRIDILDEAILRPGRFDRLIEFPLPNLGERVEILKIHTRRMAIGEDVDLRKIAGMTDGASGAELKAIVIEAAYFAIRRNDAKVCMKDFMSAIDKVMGVYIRGRGNRKVEIYG